MNERIRELAKQASKDNIDGYPVTLEYTNRFAEKFAELIIKECANLNFYHTGEVTRDGEMIIGDMILEHFGVDK